MSDCLFCQIVKKELPSEIIFQDDSITVFKDINPAAPVHLLVVPNDHIVSVQETEQKDEKVLGKLLLGAKKAAEMTGISKSGYRLIINNGPDGNQVVFNLHLHVLGGRKMVHPMG